MYTVKQNGITIVELMVAIALLSVLAGLAIPLYDGYVRESHLTAMRVTINGMRTPIEDYRLENGNYGSNATHDQAAIQSTFGWTPSGDLGRYSYTMVVTATNSYDIYGQYSPSTDVWVRCEDRFTTCCDSETSSGGGPTDGC